MVSLFCKNLEDGKWKFNHKINLKKVAKCILYNVIFIQIKKKKEKDVFKYCKI